ncbi:MAG: hypothetical protein IPP64_05790 [Bacteroidetes bacterium]|nr:hypothetical protein [Bacteroidota bacterium]
MTHKIHHYENIHIPLWLLKDTCWMMEWRIMGIIMIIPTLTVSLIIAYSAWKEKDDEFWIKTAISFWISANSYWMVCEFVKHEELKYFAAIPFIAGMICVSYFYTKRLLLNKKNKEIL